MDYYYIDYLYKEFYLKERDIRAVPETGRADDVCDEIAGKDYITRQFEDISFENLRYAVCCLCDNPKIDTRHDALMYIVWMAAINIKEQRTIT